MSTATQDRREQEDRESPVDRIMSDAPYPDVKASEAQETPLTREAVVHLRAAAMEVDRGCAKVRSLLTTVDRALAEPHGGDKTFSEEERLDLAELITLARDIADREMARPVFERGRGERPHADGPSLTLDEEDLWALGEELWRIARAGSYAYRDNRTEEGYVNCLDVAAEAANRLCDRLFERAGIPLGEATNNRLGERTHGFTEQAAQLGRDALGPVDAE